MNKHEFHELMRISRMIIRHVHERVIAAHANFENKMKKIILLAALMLISHHWIFAQKDTLKINKIWRTGINYKSYVITDNQLLALNDSGKLVIWDLNKLDTIHFINNIFSIEYTAIAKDRF